MGMHRDKNAVGMSCKWPEWYRRTHVDVSEASLQNKDGRAEKGFLGVSCTYLLSTVYSRPMLLNTV